MPDTAAARLQHDAAWFSAAETGSIEVLSALGDALVNSLNRDGQTALHVAASKGSVSAVEVGVQVIATAGYSCQV